MNIALLLFYGILNLLFVLLASPLFISLIKKVKAHAQGRHGPSILQTYRNLMKLRKKPFTHRMHLGSCGQHRLST